MFNRLLITLGGATNSDQDDSQFDNIPEDSDQIEAGADAYESGCKPNTNSNSNSVTGSGSVGVVTIRDIELE